MDKAAAEAASREERAEGPVRGRTRSDRRCRPDPAALLLATTTSGVPEAHGLRRQRHGRPSDAASCQQAVSIGRAGAASLAAPRHRCTGSSDMPWLMLCASRRLLTAIPTLFVVVTLAFFLIRIAPGGPFNLERGLSPEIMANLRSAYRPRRAALAAIRPLSAATCCTAISARATSTATSPSPSCSPGPADSVQLGALALIAGAAHRRRTLGIVAALSQNRCVDYAVIATGDGRQHHPDLRRRADAPAGLRR